MDHKPLIFWSVGLPGRVWMAAFHLSTKREEEDREGGGCGVKRLNACSVNESRRSRRFLRPSYGHWLDKEEGAWGRCLEQTGQPLQIFCTRELTQPLEKIGRQNNWKMGIRTMTWDR